MKLLSFILLVFIFQSCDVKTKSDEKNLSSDLSVEEFTLLKIFERASNKKDMNDWVLTKSSFDGSTYICEWGKGNLFDRKEYSKINWKFIKEPIGKGMKWGELVHPYLTVPCRLKDTYNTKTGKEESFEIDPDVLQVFISPEDEELFQKTVKALKEN